MRSVMHVVVNCAFADGVQQGAFLSQKHLAVLDVSSNRVNNIEIGAFEGLSALRHLSLSGNRLSKFNSDVFDGKTRWCAVHRIRFSFPLVRLSGAEKLEKLDVSNNFIGEFPSVALKKFDNLKTLNLSSNLIQVRRVVPGREHCRSFQRVMLP